MGKQFAKVDCRYGAPMGRREYREIDPTPKSVHCFKVCLDSGGCDDGGAYWGFGKQPLYCLAQDISNPDTGEHFRAFIRAANRQQAMVNSGLSAHMFKRI